MLPEFDMIQEAVHIFKLKDTKNVKEKVGYTKHQDTGPLITDPEVVGYEAEKLIVLTFVFCSVNGLRVTVKWASGPGRDFNKLVVLQAATGDNCSHTQLVFVNTEYWHEVQPLCDCAIVRVSDG